MPNNAPYNPVSVIIPTYNRSWGLKIAIESVLAQTVRDFELVVVDDCSSDDTAGVVNSFEDSRITYFRQGKNVGMVANWGAGLSLATGEFVSFLMDDDYLRPTFLENRMKHLKVDQNIVAVFSQYEIRDRAGNLVGVHNQERQEQCRLDSLGLLSAALSRQWFVGAAVYRKSAVAQAWDAIRQDDLVLDFGLNIQLALATKSAGLYIPVNDFVMTTHSGQNSQAKSEQVFEQTSAVLMRLLRQGIRTNQHALIRRELAQWYVVTGRSRASDGRIQSARQHFLKAVSTDPSLAWAWRQLAVSCILPTRLKQSAVHK